MDYASFRDARDYFALSRWIRATFSLSILLLPVVAVAQADIQSVLVIPQTPTTQDELILRVSGDVFNTSFQLGSPAVTIVGAQISVTIDGTDSGIGFPVVLPYSIDVPIGLLSPGNYDYVVTLRQIPPLFPVPIVIDQESGMFSVTALVPALSGIFRAAYCLVIAFGAIAARRYCAANFRVSP